MDQYITLSQTHPIVTATDEEVATWVLGGIKAAHHGGDLPEPLQDMYSFQTPRAAEAAAGAVIMGMKRDVTLEDIDECRPHVEAVRQILAEHLPKLISAGEFSKNTFLKLKRGEELLCDDFAVIHSQDPLAVATGFEKLFLNHGGDSKHPPNATRLGRSTKLARRVIAGREMLGRETASKELLEPLTLEPATYRQWTNDIAKVSGTVKDAADTIPLPPQ